MSHLSVLAAIAGDSISGKGDFSRQANGKLAEFMEAYYRRKIL